MAWQTNVLVIANQTAGSDELIEALKRRAANGPAKFTLLMPAGPRRRAEARKRLDAALEHMWDEGIDVKGTLGVDTDPIFCVGEAWDPAVYDEIVVSTFPTGISHWLNLDLPQRVARLTDAPVEHVVAHAKQKVTA